MITVFKFRSGKHKGRTLDWVSENDPSYLAWIKENQPKMLEPTKVKQEAPKKDVPKKEVKFDDTPKSAMRLNDNFDNEGPDPRCIPYLTKMMEEKIENNTEEDYNF